MHHVLLVDPSPGRDVLAERLRMQGYLVTAVADGATGAHLALSEPPAIVIADLWMPGISGIQLCRLLRSEPATEAVPVVLRGPEQTGRDRFWAERAGADAYVTTGRMGDLVRAIASAIAASPPQADAFFTQLSGGELDLRDRIASRLDAALFDSVIASEVRALGQCGTFDRLFDLLSQFVVQVASYRWLAVYTARPERLGLHCHPAMRARAEAEARAAFGLPESVAVIPVEDEDASAVAIGPTVRIEALTLGTEILGRVAMAPLHAQATDDELVRIIARELGGPVRIATLMEESQRLALIDPLTELLNRRAFVSAATREIDRHQRHGEPLSVVLLDVDHFKAVNDQHGHPAGDAVLAALGRLLPARLRRTDLVGRWGGEEFVVALTGAGGDAAANLAETLRAAVAAMTVRDARGEAFPVTASFGVATCRPGDTVETLVDRADRAMYTSKHSGRNRVTVESPGSMLALVAH
jgi:two-component system cell cycle response regulator